MTEILMVRHGQSVWNAQGRWQGQADPPLSDLGVRQARAGAEALAAIDPFDAVVTSNLDRAATTGAIIADRLGFAPPYRCADLNERSAGEWSGLTRADIDREYPGHLRQRRYPPGYERDPEFLVRVRRGLDDVVGRCDGKRILVVAHGGLIYCLEGSLGLAFQHIANLGGRWMTLADGAITLGPRVDLLADFDGETTYSNVP